MSIQRPPTTDNRKGGPNERGTRGVAATRRTKIRRQERRNVNGRETMQCVRKSINRFKVYAVREWVTMFVHTVPSCLSVSPLSLPLIKCAIDTAFLMFENRPKSCREHFIIPCTVGSSTHGCESCCGTRETGKRKRGGLGTPSGAARCCSSPGRLGPGRHPSVGPARHR